jgi:hypothetical protein
MSFAVEEDALHGAIGRVSVQNKEIFVMRHRASGGGGIVGHIPSSEDRAPRLEGERKAPRPDTGPASTLSDPFADEKLERLPVR